MSQTGSTGRPTNQRRTIIKKYSLLKRATAAAVLSATIATPAVFGLTAGTASARPICDALFASGQAQADSYHEAVNAGQSSEANFWLREFRLTRTAYKQNKCG